jgi:hypothetical protein
MGLLMILIFIFILSCMFRLLVVCWSGDIRIISILSSLQKTYHKRLDSNVGPSRLDRAQA